MKSAHLFKPTHPGRRTGVEHQNVRADLGKDAARGGLVRHVGGNGGDAQPGADGLKRIGAAGNDRHFGALRDQGLDEAETQSAAATGDDDSLIFEVHLPTPISPV